MPRTIRYQSGAADRVLIVTNPSAGSGTNQHRVRELADRLTSDGMRVETTSELELVHRKAAAPAQAGLRAVVAAGGDGTVAALINRTCPDTPIAVLPLGTENLLAKYLHMLVTPEELSHAITHGATVRLDAGQAGNRIFMLMTGCGFDADVVRRLHAHRSGNIRHLSYVKPIVDSIRKYQYPALRVHCERAASAVHADSGGNAQHSTVFTASWLFVVNLPRYAGGLRLRPTRMAPTDCSMSADFEKGSLWHGLRYLRGVVRGRHLSFPDCRYVQTSRVRIESDEEVHYQLDGDPGGTLPLEITILPERVSLIVTETWAFRRGFLHAR